MSSVSTLTAHRSGEEPESLCQTRGVSWMSKIPLKDSSTIGVPTQSTKILGLLCFRELCWWVSWLRVQIVSFSMILYLWALGFHLLAYLLLNGRSLSPPTLKSSMTVDAQKGSFDVMYARNMISSEGSDCSCTGAWGIYHIRSSMPCSTQAWCPTERSEHFRASRCWAPTSRLEGSWTPT